MDSMVLGSVNTTNVEYSSGRRREEKEKLKNIKDMIQSLKNHETSKYVMQAKSMSSKSRRRKEER